MQIDSGRGLSGSFDEGVVRWTLGRVDEWDFGGFSVAILKGVDS